MITRAEFNRARRRAAEILAKTGLVVRQDEIDAMEVADFGLSELEISGAQIVTLVDTGQIAAKLLVLFPGQTEPEHTHVRIGGYAGKEETIRCAWGELFLYVPGEAANPPRCQPPAHHRGTYSVWHEVALSPGEQVTLAPNTPHWFQGGPQGVVIWSFSTKAVDGNDVFSDPDIVRQTVIVD
jgi:D-lyxose ketol-isomerase